MKNKKSNLPKILLLTTTFVSITLLAFFSEKSLAKCPPKTICAGTANCPQPPAFKKCSSISSTNECNAYEQGRAACNTGSYAKCTDNEFEEQLPPCAYKTVNDTLSCGTYNCAVGCTWENGVCVDDPSSECSDSTCAPECKDGQA